MIPLPNLTATQVARFNAQVTPGDGCWLWTGEVTNNGHGRFVLWPGGRRLRLLAHRVAYFLDTGTDPGEDLVRHSCDNPPCVNPAHLSTGRQKDNMGDARARGRLNLTGLEEWRRQRDAVVASRLEANRKTCAVCRVAKTLEEFARHRGYPDGRQYRCKSCVSQAARTRRGAA